LISMPVRPGRTIASHQEKSLWNLLLPSGHG
jgi:hypothetical protein